MVWKKSRKQCSITGEYSYDTLIHLPYLFRFWTCPLQHFSNITLFEIVIQFVYPLEMVMFYSSVSVPNGTLWQYVVVI